MRYDICAVRAFAILLIVLHHAAYYLTAIPTGVDFVPLQGSGHSAYLSYVSKFVGLGLFTYISGMLLAMQANRPRNVGAFVIKKVTRLLVPCAIFLIAYDLIFGDVIGGSYQATLGCTHLWYLPFIFIALTVTYILRPTWSASGIAPAFAVWAACLYLESFKGVYISHMHVYYPVFLAGYFHNHLCNRYTALCGGLLAATLFWHPVRHWFINLPIISIFYITLVCILASWAVVYTAGRVVRGPLGRVGTLLDRQSFHIYLIHQFVLNFILMALPLSGLAIKWTFPVFLLTLGGSLALCLAYDAASASVVRAYRRLRPVNTP